MIDGNLVRPTQDAAVIALTGDGVTPRQRRLRAERPEGSLQLGNPLAIGSGSAFHGPVQACGQFAEVLGPACDASLRGLLVQAGREGLQDRLLAPHARLDGPLQTGLRLVESLSPSLDEAFGVLALQASPELGEPRSIAGDPSDRAAMEASLQ